MFDRKALVPLALGAMLLATGASAQTVELSAGALGKYADDNSATVVLTPGITNSNDLPSPALIRARKAMVEKRPVPFSTMRQLADLGDGFAAYNVAKILADSDGNVRPDDVAHYFGIAAATGRSSALYGMIHAIDRFEPGEVSESRLRILRQILSEYAQAGNSIAAKAVHRYHNAGVPFGSFQTTLDAIIDNPSTEGSDAFALQRAIQILQRDTGERDDLEQARSYLDRALESESVSVLAIAQNLSKTLDEKIAALPEDLSDAPAPSLRPEPATLPTNNTEEMN